MPPPLPFQLRVSRWYVTAESLVAGFLRVPGEDLRPRPGGPTKAYPDRVFLDDE
ncbi:MAG: hypothetical protein M3Q10_06450 [Chloroflexota bacterium]|nr:hypothetical protein [Chloroflexota bacterium]